MAAKEYLDKDGLSVLWTKIKATFALITHTHTVSEITNFPSSMTPSSHTHGNIQNGGTLQSSDVAIGNGDKLVITDSSDSNKVARASLSFDGSTATQALTKKGTWETFNNYTHPTVTIDGVSFNASAGIIHYGTCNITSASATVSCTGFTLATGAWIAVQFTGNTSSSSNALQLNINGTGAKYVKYYHGSDMSMPSNAGIFSNNKVFFLVYDGTSYRIVGELDTNTTYTLSGSNNTITLTDSNGGTTSATVSDTKATQAAAITTSGAYPVILAYSTATTAVTNTLNKSSTLTYNPSTKALLTGGSIDGYVLGDACQKLVDTSISSGSSSSNLPTTAAVATYVDGEIGSAISGTAAFKGEAPTTFAPTNYKGGWHWLVTTAGTYCGETCDVGDMIYAKTDGTTFNAANFTIVQTNIAPISSTDINNLN